MNKLVYHPILLFSTEFKEERLLIPIFLQKMTSQVEVKTQIFVWLDFPDWNYLWSDFLDRKKTFQIQFTTDPTFQTQKVSGQTSQTESFLIRPYSEHGPDSLSDHWPDLNKTMIRLKCARKGYDQTQMRSKHLSSDPVALAAIYDQTEACSKPVLIRIKCARNSLIR